MRVLLVAVAILLLHGVASAQTVNPPCSTGASRGMGEGANVTSLGQLIDEARVIVDAYVQATGPGLVHQLATPNIPQLAPFAASPRQFVETDVLMAATNVLKGPNALKQFVVPMLMGRSLEMKAGQRYIVFLDEETPKRLQQLAVVPGVPRYAVTGDYSGLFCIEDGKIHLDNGSRIRTQFESAGVDKVLAQISDYAGAIPLTGRLVVENGTFPLEGSVTPIPYGGRERRIDLRIVFTPAGDGRADAGAAPPEAMVINLPFDSLVPSNSRGRADSKPSPRIAGIDRNGLFHVGLDRGVYRVTVEGGLPFGYSLKSVTYGSVDLTTGRLDARERLTGEIHVTLTRQPHTDGVRVGGRITDIPVGIPLDHAWVMLVSDGDQNVRAAAAPIPQDGRFEFPNVPPGAYKMEVFLQALVSGMGWGRPPSRAITVSDQPVRVELPLLRGQEVTVLIVAGNRNPASSVGSLEFNPVDQPPIPPSRYSEGRTLLSSNRGAPGRVWLAPGNYSITVNSSGGVGSATRATFSVRSIVSGSTDLMKGTLMVDGSTLVAPIVITLD